MKRLVPSPAIAIAFTALAVAFTGTSSAAPVREAASKLITGSKIAKGAITGTHVKNRSLTAADFKAGQLPRGARGPAGAPGATGASGAQGPAGPAGPQGPGAATAWARVSDGGTLVAGSGVSTARRANNGGSQGQFEVVFNRDVTGCGWFATHVSDLSSPVAGGIAVSGPANGQVPQNQLDVSTRNGQGTLTFAPFTVLLVC